MPSRVSTSRCLPFVFACLLTSVTPYAVLTQESSAEDAWKVHQEPSPGASTDELLDYCRMRADESAIQDETFESRWRRIYDSKKSVLRVVDRILARECSEEVEVEALGLKFDALNRLADSGTARLVYEESELTAFANYREQLRRFSLEYSNSRHLDIRRKALINRGFALSPAGEDAARVLVSDVDRFFESQQPLKALIGSKANLGARH